MKLHKLSIYNLTSLKGKTTIDFDKPPLYEASIFSITGKTGAGKSTIFDAISLALFGKTDRDHVQEIMSNGTGESYAEVEFSTNGKRYRARWGQHRTRKKMDGNLQPAEMTLSIRNKDGSYDILAEKVNAVRNQVEEITGLDVDKFSTSVVLAQRKFDRFLQASPNDRANLLEKLTGSEIYQKLSKLAYEITKSKKEKLTQLEQQTEQMEIMSEDQLNILNESVQTNQKAIQPLQKEIQQLNTQKTLLTSYQTKQKEQHDLQTAQEQQVKKRQDFERTYRDKLKAQSILEPLREKFNNRSQLLQQHGESKQQTTSLDATFKKLKEQEKQTDHQVKLSEKTFKEFQEQTQKAQTEIQQAKVLDDRIKQLSDDAKKALHSMQALKQQLDQDESLISTKKTTLLAIDKTIDSISQKQKDSKQLIDYEIVIDWRQKALELKNDITNQSISTPAKPKPAADLATLKSTIQTELKQLESHQTTALQLNNDFNEWRRKEAALSNLQKKYNELAAKQKQLTQNIKTATKEYHSNEQIHEQLKKAKEQNQFFLLLKDARSQLTEHDPCPLCGSVEHDLEQALQLTHDAPISEDALHAAAKNEQATKDKFIRLTSQNDTLQENITALQSEIKQDTTEWNTLQQTINKQLDAVKEIIPAFTDCSASDFYTKWQVHIRELRKEYDLIQYQQQVAALNKLENKLQNLPISGWDSMDFEQRYKDFVQEASNLKSALEKNKLDQQNLQLAIRELVTKHDTLQLQYSKEKKACQAKEDLIQQETKQRKSLLNGLSIQDFQDKLMTKHNRLSQERDTLINQKNDIQKKLNQCAGNLEASKKLTEDLIKKGKDLSTQILASLQPKYTTVDAAQKDLLDLGSLAKIRDLEEQLKLEKSTLDTKLEAIQKWHESNKEAIQTIANVQIIDLDHSIQEKEATRTQYERTIGQAKEKLRQHEQQVKKQSQLKKQINKQSAETQRWERLNELIGSATGDKFKKFAQSITLQMLIQLSNKHLQQLDDRYALTTDTNSGEMEFEVIDYYQADNQRTIKTLSGGERFLVSLALSLGLSELSGGLHRSEILFIDEGFGSLDDQTLDKVLMALTNLQSSGKRIGIISHVEGLRKRFPANIHIQKHPSGSSTIDIN